MNPTRSSQGRRKGNEYQKETQEEGRYATAVSEIEE